MGLFQKAERKQAKLRLGLVGPSGAGKTMTALRIAMGLVPGGRIAVVDTERGSARLYAGEETPEGVADFDVLELDSFEPDRFLQAIKAAGDEGYDVLIVDSLSHAWEGVLEKKDQVAARSRSSDTFGAWRTVTPIHNELVDTLLRAPMHVIATMRAKTVYEHTKYTDSRGKQRTKIEKIGLAPVQRAGMEYEFTVVADVDLEENALVISKTRCPMLSGKVFPRAGGDVADILRGWLGTGASATDALDAALGEAGIKGPDWLAWCQAHGKSFSSDGQRWSAAEWVRGPGGATVRAWVIEQDQADHSAESTPEPAKWSKAQQAGFFAAVQDHVGPDKVCTYDELAAWCTANGRPRPSVMPEEQRERLVAAIVGAPAIAVEVAEWAAKQAADGVAA
jgi:hypothetical protein